MSATRLSTDLRAERARRGWSQAQVAAGSGISRAAVSAIETGKLTPSAAAALALARLFEVPVEALFRLTDEDEQAEAAWAWESQGPCSASWVASLDDGPRRFPIEVTAAGLITPDDPHAIDQRRAESTLVLAGCDPAVGLLCDSLRGHDLRLIPFSRSSGQALDLLAKGKVHAAGIHLDDNRRAARAKLGDDHCLLHLARWDQGLSLSRDLQLDSISAAVDGSLRWVGREAGSGARNCLDRILEGKERPEGYDRIARNHEGVVQTIASGWAQAGVCVRFSAERAGLQFLSVQQESYDLAVSREFLDSARGAALLDVLRSKSFRRELASAAGYDTGRSGEVTPLGN